MKKIAKKTPNNNNNNNNNKLTNMKVFDDESFNPQIVNVI